MEDYENLRRRIYSNTKELWYYVNHQLSKVKNEDQKDSLQAILDQVADRKRLVYACWSLLSIFIVVSLNGI